MNIITEIINWLAGGVMYAIWGCLGIGILCGTEALLHINNEENYLHRNTTNMLLGTSPHHTERMSTLKKWLDNHKEVRVGQGHHLLLRLQTIYDSVGRTESRVMPSLHDLHILTMQDEMSRFWPNILRTITSFLLILGIFGTLSGVHGVVGGNIEASALSPALEPSMWAVGSTVLLMWLRGGYLAMLDKYLEHLDLFTLTEIIPMLQPSSKIGQANANLNVQMRDLYSKVELVQNMAEHMQHVHQSISASVSGATKVKQDIENLLEAVKKENDQLLLAEGSTQEHMNELAELINNSSNLCGEIEMGTKGITYETEKMTQNASSVKLHYERLSSYLDSAVKEVNTGAQQLSTLEEDAHLMSQLGKTISGYEHNLTNIVNKIDGVNRAIQHIHELHEEIKDSPSRVNNSAVQAQNALSESQKYLVELSTYNKDFRKDMDDGKYMIDSALEKFDRQLKELEKQAQGLSNAWEKRMRKINI